MNVQARERAANHPIRPSPRASKKGMVGDKFCCRVWGYFRTEGSSSVMLVAVAVLAF